MPFFYHPDIKSQHYHFQFFSKGIFNIYEYVFQNKNKLEYRDTFNYLPLTYYTFGVTQTVLKPFLGNGFYTWINDWGETKENNPNLIYYLFLLKIPYLFLDIGLGLLLFKIYSNKQILYLWFFNPVSIYLIYILGNFDILPSFLTVLSFYFLKNKKISLSYLSIGIAIALKMYPVIFLPFIFFYDRKKFFLNLKNCWLSILPLVLTVIPFIKQKSFIDSFLGSGLTQKLLEFRLYCIPVFPVFFALIFIFYFFSSSKYKFEVAVAQLCLIFFGVVKFHPQWLIWFLPFVSLIFIKSNLINKLTLIIFLVLFFVYVFLINDNYLFWGHLIPIDSNFINLTSPYQLLKLKFFYDPLVIQKIIHNIILFFGIIVSLFYVKKD